jgi:hypothetical protein
MDRQIIHTSVPSSALLSITGKAMTIERETTRRTLLNNMTDRNEDVKVRLPETSPVRAKRPALEEEKTRGYAR